MTGSQNQKDALLSGRQDSSEEYGAIERFRQRMGSSSEERRSIMESLGSVTMSVRDNVHNSLNFSGSLCSVRDLGGQSTIAKSVFNLIKNLVGAGVLALPGGVASFADSPTGVIPATVWLIAMGAAFGYYFQVIGKICDLKGSATYRETWEDTMGDKGAFWVATVNMLKPALGNLSYSMILADTFQSLSATIGFALTRNETLLLITVFAILPLCLLKNLDALAPCSILGLVGIFFTAFAMGMRYFDGTYAQPDGIFLQDLEPEFLPKFGTYNGAWTSNVFVFCSMAFEAFMAHYNAPRFLAELKNPTLNRYGIVVSTSFGVSALIYILMTAFGFLTFGGNCNGYILNNYSNNDHLATLCRMAIAFSTLFTYPIVFLGFRDGILDMLELPPEKHTANNLNALTGILLIIITCFAAVVTDLGFIAAVGGGTLATAIVFVFPAFMFQAAVNNLNTPISKNLEREVKFALFLMVVGVIMGIIGVWIELSK